MKHQQFLSEFMELGDNIIYIQVNLCCHCVPCPSGVCQSLESRVGLIFWSHLTSRDANWFLSFTRLRWNHEQVLATPKLPCQGYGESSGSRLVDCSCWAMSALDCLISTTLFGTQNEQLVISSTVRILLCGIWLILLFWIYMGSSASQTRECWCTFIVRHNKSSKDN